MVKLYSMPLRLLLFLLIFTGLALPAQTAMPTGHRKVNKVLYYTPVITPDVAEIKDATYNSFFSAVTDHFSTIKHASLLRTETAPYGDVTGDDIREICVNNSADYAVLPHIKFFKVGIGKYVLSSQVVVSLKLYDAAGNFISESSYDTFRKNGRILGSAENNIKRGTEGAIKALAKEFRKKQLLAGL